MEASASADDAVVAGVRALAAAWDGANGDEAFPADRLAALRETGALTAFLSLDDNDAVLRLLAVLRLVGGADLSLGRVFEGHVNAAQLVHAYGTPAQRRTLLQNLAAGCVFGVWNTEQAPGVTIARADGGSRLEGAKTFATGAGHLDRVLITARAPGGSKQMVLVDVADERGRADNHGWQVRGMRGTRSGVFDFSGLVVGEHALIGEPDDYEREPRFSGGAWRFAAVQLGAAEALLRHWRDHLRGCGKDADPIQRARFAGAVVAARSAGLWVARAAILAEAGRDEAIPHVLMTRGVVEDAALLVMEGAARGLGTAAFFTASRVDRITRDLGLYLRQPVPDQARDRAAAAWLEADRWGDDLWW